jgi:hypothetical protein
MVCAEESLAHLRRRSLKGEMSSNLASSIRFAIAVRNVGLRKEDVIGDVRLKEWVRRRLPRVEVK